MTQTAILGAGVMGETLLSGLVRAGRRVDHLLVGEKRPERARELEERYGVSVVGVISGHWGGTPHGNVGQPLDGVYGRLQMDTDGSYTYTPTPISNWPSANGFAMYSPTPSATDAAARPAPG